ncbi:hypothetical protein BGW38_004397 [Lunasporangiospora selenospora]|uniref:Uncharacterized protein n=1 Tax=Lunasporangiospora selenospora TaxID=979761 RepID=A0A9P6FQ63_9FUNG|nr:hypothetical protein BGW38_004397 [Lunasporangiospora selenospora]
MKFKSTLLALASIIALSSAACVETQSEPLGSHTQDLEEDVADASKLLILDQMPTMTTNPFIHGPIYRFPPYPYYYPRFGRPQYPHRLYPTVPIAVPETRLFPRKDEDEHVVKHRPGKGGKGKAEEDSEVDLNSHDYSNLDNAVALEHGNDEAEDDDSSKMSWMPWNNYPRPWWMRGPWGRPYNPYRPRGPMF